MSDKRISALTEQTGLNTGDFFAIDNAGETESKKIDQAYFSGQYDDMQNILGSKNLMPNEASTQVVSGITFTKYSDGRIKANGTASANINFTLSSSFWLPKGDYILTDGVKNQSYYVDIKNGSTVIARARDDGAFTLAADTTLLSEIWISSGQTVSNVTFYPMVRPANIPSTEYVPYAKSNKELTEDVASLNASLTWKKSLNGGDISNLNFTELYIVVKIGGTVNLAVFNILAAMLTSTVQYIRQGSYATSTNTAGVTIGLTSSNITIITAYVNDTNYASTSTIEVYYR